MVSLFAAFKHNGEPDLMNVPREEVNEEDGSSRRQEDCVFVTENGSEMFDKCEEGHRFPPWSDTLSCRCDTDEGVTLSLL